MMARLFILAVGLFWWSAWPSLGQELYDEMPELVVNERQFDVSLDNPLNVSGDVVFIDRDALERLPANSLPDVLKEGGNVMFRSASGKGRAGELSMRGFGENSGLRVLVVLDGHAMNRADMGVQDWQQFSVSDIESIAIRRGGQSVLYGGHALSGVIDIQTREGGTEGGELRAALGSFGFEQYSARVTGDSGKAYYAAGVNYQQDEGFRTNSLSWSYNAHSSLGIFLNETDALTLRVSAGEGYDQLPGPLSFAEYRDEPRQSRRDGLDFTRADHASLLSRWTGERGWGRMQLNAGVNWRDLEWQLGSAMAVNEQYGYSLAPRFTFGQMSGNMLTTGMDVRYDTLGFDGDRPNDENRADFNRLTVGPYVWVRNPMTRTLTLSYGARYESATTFGENRNYSKSVGPATLPNPWILGGPPIPNVNYTPRAFIPAGSYARQMNKQGWGSEVSLNWKVDPTWSVWTRYNRVYRYPALDETGAYQGYALSVPFNERLDPETGNNFEVGVKSRTAHWEASATAFCLLLDDMISFDDTVKINTNLSSTVQFGADVLLSYERELVGFSAMAEWVKATFDGGENDGHDVPLVPEAHGIFSVWVKPLNPLRLTGTYSWVAAQYQGGDFENGSRRLASYGLVGMRMDLEMSPQMKVFLRVDNLLDQIYASSAYGGVYYPGSGRAFYSGVSLEF